MVSLALTKPSSLTGLRAPPQYLPGRVSRHSVGGPQVPGELASVTTHTHKSLSASLVPSCANFSASSKEKRNFFPQVKKSRMAGCEATHEIFVTFFLVFKTWFPDGFPAVVGEPSAQVRACPYPPGHCWSLLVIEGLTSSLHYLIIVVMGDTITQISRFVCHVMLAELIGDQFLSDAVTRGGLLLANICNSRYCFRI